MTDLTRVQNAETGEDITMRAHERPSANWAFPNDVLSLALPTDLHDNDPEARGFVQVENTPPPLPYLLCTDRAEQILRIDRETAKWRIEFDVDWEIRL